MKKNTQLSISIRAHWDAKQTHRQNWNSEVILNRLSDGDGTGTSDNHTWNDDGEMQISMRCIFSIQISEELELELYASS